MPRNLATGPPRHVLGHRGVLGTNGHGSASSTKLYMASVTSHAAAQ